MPDAAASFGLSVIRFSTSGSSLALRNVILHPRWEHGGPEQTGPGFKIALSRQEAEGREVLPALNLWPSNVERADLPLDW